MAGRDVTLQNLGLEDSSSMDRHLRGDGQVFSDPCASHNLVVNNNTL